MPCREVDNFIPLDRVQEEARKLRGLLDAGEGDGDMLYGAYQALLMVLNYGVLPPSQAFGPVCQEQRNRLRRIGCGGARPMLSLLRMLIGCWHRWEPWEVHGKRDDVWIRETRRCQKCGYVQQHIE